MNISNWSKEYQELVKELSEKLQKESKEELSMRIAVALFTQDSCERCESLTMKKILEYGSDGIFMCKPCTLECY